MSLEAVHAEANRHYRRQSSIARRVAVALSRLWVNVDPDRIGDTWRMQIALAAGIITAGQAAAAQDADTYTAKQAALQSGKESPFLLDTAAFAGFTASGQDLETLLALPAITARFRIGQGASVREGMLAGKAQLALLGSNEVQQAGRNAGQIAITANRGIPGYVRMLRAPSCSRCVILAGRFYKYSRGFARHPRCDCVHVPSIEDTVKDSTTDPRGYFDSLTEAEQNKTFGVANAKAIRDGSDIGEVVNIYRRDTKGKSQLYTFDTPAGTKQATLEGTNVLQGRAGRRLALLDRQLVNADGSIRKPDFFERSAPRLTPRQIYKDATSRDDAIRLLFDNGYLKPKDIRRGYQGVYADLGADRRGFRNGLPPTNR